MRACLDSSKRELEGGWKALLKTLNLAHGELGRGNFLKVTTVPFQQLQGPTCRSVIPKLNHGLIIGELVNPHTLAPIINVTRPCTALKNNEKRCEKHLAAYAEN